MNKNIIFIDDELEILNSYNEMFKSIDVKTRDEIEKLTGQKIDIEFDDVKVFTSNSGKEGVDIVRRQKEKRDPIRIAFVDMRMPNGINGLETAVKLHEIDSNIEIVFVTAYSDINLKEINNTIRRDGKILYLKKPFSEDEIKQIVKNLCAKCEATGIKDNFISHVTHELRTPLSSMIGMLSLLKDEDDLSEDQKELVDYSLKSSNLLNGLINNLIEISNIERTDNNNIEMVNLGDLLDHMEKIFIEQINDKNLYLEVKDTDYIFKTDRNKISQVIINIISNAIKFTDEGGIVLSKGSDCYGNYLEIKDTGVGMSKDNLDNIFKKFFRIENVHHETEGLGLGLFICKKILTSLNHQIEVDSKVGEGSTFRIRI